MEVRLALDADLVVLLGDARVGEEVEMDDRRSLDAAVALAAESDDAAGLDGAEVLPHHQRLRALAELRAPIARFFDDVLVMAEDARVRANRLALLNQTLSLFYRIADISSLGGSS